MDARAQAPGRDYVFTGSLIKRVSDVVRFHGPRTDSSIDISKIFLPGAWTSNPFT